MRLLLFWIHIHICNIFALIDHENLQLEHQLEQEKCKWILLSESRRQIEHLLGQIQEYERLLREQLDRLQATGTQEHQDIPPASLVESTLIQLRQACADLRQGDGQKQEDVLVRKIISIFKGI